MPECVCRARHVGTSQAASAGSTVNPKFCSDLLHPKSRRGPALQSSSSLFLPRVRVSDRGVQRFSPLGLRKALRTTLPPGQRSRQERSKREGSGIVTSQQQLSPFRQYWLLLAPRESWDLQRDLKMNLSMLSTGMRSLNASES